MEAEDPIRVETPTVRCDGGGEPLGHPAVYLTFGKDGVIVCPYCSLRYIRAAGADRAVDH